MRSKEVAWMTFTGFLMALGLVFVQEAGADDYTQWALPVMGIASDTQITAVSAADYRTTIGVGEKVDLSFTWRDEDCNTTTAQVEEDDYTIGSIEWSFDSGSAYASLSSTTGETTVLTAETDLDGAASRTCRVRIEADDSGTKYNDPTGYTTKDFTIINPTGETTWHQGWSNQISLFGSQLTPTTVVFSKIGVKEVDGGGGSDECWFSGSQYSKADTLSGGAWNIDTDNTWDGYDYIGWGSVHITYYRDQDRAPCSSFLDQEMAVIKSGIELYDYVDHTLEREIGVTNIANTRNNVTASKTWP